jgi:deazaflavin-dependent oxidoreductase (nitroreductase family)
MDLRDICMAASPPAVLWSVRRYSRTAARRHRSGPGAILAHAAAGGDDGAMPLPKALARANRHVANPVLRPLAERLPGFAVLLHVGRRSGKHYRTPVNLFVQPDGRRIVALTYGADSQWVRNVLAAGEVEAITRGQRVRLVHPRVLPGEAGALIPPPARWILAAIHVDDVMALDPAER